MPELSKSLERVLEPAVGPRIIRGLQIDIGEVGQYAGHAPPVVDFTVLGKAVVMIVPRSVMAPLRGPHVPETVQRPREAADVAARPCGRAHVLE